MEFRNRLVALLAERGTPEAVAALETVDDAQRDRLKSLWDKIDALLG